MSGSPVSRFTGRAGNYDRFRPDYPAELFQWLKAATGLGPGARVADMGSGTGLFTELLLKEGFAVVAVEPNPDMRAQAEARLGTVAGFTSSAGSAEHTGLDDRSIDLITAAQAFHWFSPAAVRPEFGRILKPGGHAVLVWNIQRDDKPFLSEYKALKEKYSEAMNHTHRANLESIRDFFAPAIVNFQTFPHAHAFDRESLRGYLLSFSTTPLSGDARFDAMMQELDALFARHQQDGVVQMEYETKVYLAQISSDGNP